MRAHRRRAAPALALAALLGLWGCEFEDLKTVAEGTLKSNFASEDYVKTRDMASAALARDPDDANALKMLGWSEFMLDRYQDSEIAFERLDRASPGTLDAALGLAWSYIKTGRYDEASRRLATAESRANGWNVFLVNDALGWLALKREDFEKAEHYFGVEDTSLSSPNSRRRGKRPDSQVGMGWVRLKQGRLDEAEGFFRRGLHRDASCHFCYDGLARVAFQRGDKDEALDLAVKGARIVRHNHGLAGLIGSILISVNDVNVGKRTYEDLIEAHPDDPLYYVGLGNVLLAKGHLVGARRAFDRARKIAPGDIGAARGLIAIAKKRRTLAAGAWADYFAGYYPRAAQTFHALRDKARIDRNPTVEEGLGWTLLAQGRPGKAKDAFERALGIDPHYAKARAGLVLARRGAMPELGLAWEFLHNGDERNAERFYGQLVAKRGPEARAFANEGFGWIDYYKGRGRDAEKAFKAALADSSDAYMASWGLALLALERGDNQAAAMRFAESLSAQPHQGASAFEAAADALIAVGRQDDARRILYRGEQAYPESAAIQSLLARVETALGEPTLGAARAKLAISLDPAEADRFADALAVRPMAKLEILAGLGWGLYFARDNQPALKRFEDYLRLGGKSLNARRGRAFALFRMKRYAEAIPELDALRRHEPVPLAAITESIPIPGTNREWPVVYNAESTLAWSYQHTGHHLKAERIFTKLLIAHPDWLDARTGLGYALLSQGKLPLSEREFRKALERYPDYPDALRGLGLAKGARP